MADLTGFGINPDVEVNDGGQKCIPPGFYKAVIVGDKLSDNKSNTGKILTFTYQIIEGPHATSTIEDRLNIVHTNATAAAIGQGTLKKICMLTKVPFPPQNTQLMYGKPLMLKVASDPYTAKDGTEKQWHKVERVDEWTGTVPQAAPVSQDAAQPVKNMW